MAHRSETLLKRKLVLRAMKADPAITHRELAKMFGYSYKAMSTFIYRMGIKQEFDEWRKSKLEKLCKVWPPLTLDQIGEKFNVTGPCINQWLIRYRMEPRCIENRRFGLRTNTKAALINAVKDGYIVANNNESGRKAWKAWREYCGDWNCPAIWVQVRITRAIIVVDLEAVSPENRDALLKDIEYVAAPRPLPIARAIQHADYMVGLLTERGCKYDELRQAGESFARA